MVMEKFELHSQLYESRRRFNKACDQIVLLGTKLSDLNQRYLNAKSHDNQLFRRSLRLRIITLEGLVKTFTHYANMKKNEILELRSKLLSRSIVVMENSDSDGDYSSNDETTSDDEYSAVDE